jgi:hypothetical protein
VSIHLHVSPPKVLDSVRLNLVLGEGLTQNILDEFNFVSCQSNIISLLYMNFK